MLKKSATVFWMFRTEIWRFCTDSKSFSAFRMSIVMSLPWKRE